jgi:hypothetical protein
MITPTYRHRDLEGILVQQVVVVGTARVLSANVEMLPYCTRLGRTRCSRSAVLRAKPSFCPDCRTSESNYLRYYLADVAPADCTLVEAAPACSYHWLLFSLTTRQNRTNRLCYPDMNRVVSHFHAHEPPQCVNRRANIMRQCQPFHP